MRVTDQAPLLFVCADDRLLDVASSEGLATENPNHHAIGKEAGVS
jgi:hypothetical protein